MEVLKVKNKRPRLILSSQQRERIEPEDQWSPNMELVIVEDNPPAQQDTMVTQPQHTPGAKSREQHVAELF